MKKNSNKEEPSRSSTPQSSFGTCAVTTNEEILKINYKIIHENLLANHPDEAAIRLARFYEAKGQADERSLWAGVITKTEWELLKAHETDTDKFTEGTARNVCRLMNEARADERKKTECCIDCGKIAHYCYDCAEKKCEAREAKGQAALIAELMATEAYKAIDGEKKPSQERAANYCVDLYYLIKKKAGEKLE